jgi:hypothetical protein
MYVSKLRCPSIKIKLKENENKSQKFLFLWREFVVWSNQDTTKETINSQQTKA